MQRGLFRYDVTACETKVFICFSIYCLCCPLVWLWFSFVSLLIFYNCHYCYFLLVWLCFLGLHGWYQWIWFHVCVYWG